MAKNTSILLGEYFEEFIARQVKSGKFSSASEVVRTALRLFEKEQTQKKALINELKKAEKTELVPNFDRKQFMKDLHAKHLKK
jgi:antitoxin ParD1/3/4